VFLYAGLALAPALVFLAMGPPPNMEVLEKPGTTEFAAQLIEAKADPKDPDILAWAAAIADATVDPKQRAALAFTTMLVHVQYALDEQTWLTAGKVRTIDELRQKAALEGWPYWRGDCKAQTIVLFSLLRALGLDASVKAHLWSKVGDREGHVWTSVRIDGKSYSMNATDDVPGERIIPLRPNLRNANDAQFAACQKLGLVGTRFVLRNEPVMLNFPNWRVRWGWAFLSLPLAVGMLLVSSDFQRWWKTRRAL